MIAIPVYVREEKNYELLMQAYESCKDNDVLFVVNAWEYNSHKIEELNELLGNYFIFRKTNSVAGAWNDAIEYHYNEYVKYGHWAHGFDIILMNQDVSINEEIIDKLTEDINESKGIAAARTKEGEPDFALFAVNPVWIKETFGTLRPFDEGYEGAYFEDNDFRYQCKLKGIEITTIDLDFKHFGSSVVKLDLEAQKENEQRFRKNHIRYINKWGGIRGQETFKTAFNK